MDVMELQEAPLAAPASSSGRHEGALPAVTAPHGALHRVWKVPGAPPRAPAGAAVRAARIRFETDTRFVSGGWKRGRSPALIRSHGFRRGSRFRGRAWRLRRLAELGFLDLLEQLVEGAVDDRGGIPIGDLTPQEGLKPPQLVARLLADGALQAVALRGQGLHDGTLRWSGQRPGSGCRIGRTCFLRWLGYRRRIEPRRRFERRSAFEPSRQRDIELQGRAFARAEFQGGCRLRRFRARSPGNGQLAHRRRDIGSGRQFGDQHPDVLESRMACARQDGLVVLRRQLWPEHADRSEAQRARPEEVDDGGEGSAGFVRP